jgi:hypothetical protein
VKELLTFLKENKEIIATLVAMIGGAFALWRWIIDQRWRRVQYAQTLIKDFMEKDYTEKVFEILDTDGPVDFFIADDEEITINITDEFLIGALSTFDQKRDNTDHELIVRDICDEFFSDLSIFQSHIEAGLIQLNDISPYLEYWMRALSGREKVRGLEFAKQARMFMDYFGYKRILILARDMNCPFPT